MKRNIPIFNQTKLPDLEKKLQKCFQKVSEQIVPNRDVFIFFRADDIGVPSLQFARLMEIFIRHRMPLCLATVPTWLTPSRLKSLTHGTAISCSQWCWHQHGWLHTNHELRGKKHEFGPSRSYHSIRKDLERGKDRLEKLLGKAFFPVFTPPWNRCSQLTLKALQDLHFKGLSRSRGEIPHTNSALPEISINVDLHTRKETTQMASCEALLYELTTSLVEGCAGIMIHHQLMNDEAFRLLDLLLHLVVENTYIRPVHFMDILSIPR